MNKPVAMTLDPIPQELILDRLRFENPWWVTRSIDDIFQRFRRRLYFDLFFPLVAEMDVRRAVVLLGPRRVGKTVMMHHAIDALLKQGVGAAKVCYIGIGNPLYLHKGLEELFTMARSAAMDEDPTGWYVFFDEIQYLKDWERHLKVMVDSYPQTKFMVSGSAAAALKVKSGESGAGRFTEFMLPPLTFHEYIHLKDLNHLIKPSSFTWVNRDVQFYTTTHLEEINRHFLDYINFGGYPEVIFSSKMQEEPGRYFNPKRALGCVAKLILALGTTMHHLSAQSKIGDFLAASYLRDLSLIF
jgi:predicted AAA+ superfamily ATPase